MKELKAQPTPGPWTWGVDNWNGGFTGLFGPDDQDVCVPLCRNDGDDCAAWFNPEDSSDRCMELTANLHLIAEAPALLDVLEELLDAGWRHDSDQETLRARESAHRLGRMVVHQAKGKA